MQRARQWGVGGGEGVGLAPCLLPGACENFSLPCPKSPRLSLSVSSTLALAVGRDREQPFCGGQFSPEAEYSPRMFRHL